MNREVKTGEYLKYTAEFPKGLEEIDKDLIVLQCEYQQATNREQIEGFAKAYKYTKDLAFSEDFFENLNAEKIEKLILDLGKMVEARNEKGFRKVPVTFKDGARALDSQKIERAMENFSGAYAENRLEPQEAFLEFEKIHPFEDGNGRLGDLLWKMAIKRKTGEWPKTLPPDVFEKEKK